MSSEEQPPALIAGLLERYRQLSGSDLCAVDQASIVRDLLTDLIHYCVPAGLNVNELVTRAEEVWSEEVEEGLTGTRVPESRDAPEWLVEFLENYAVDVRNHERHTAEEAAKHVMQYVV